MKTWLNHLKEDRFYLTGLVLSLISLGIFLAPISSNSGFVSGKFIFIYLLFVGYFIAVLADNHQMAGKAFRFYSLSHNIALLILGNLSAYALNLEFSLFHPSVTWLSVFLTVLHLVLATVGVDKSRNPGPWSYFTVAVLAAGTVLQLYQTLYLLPITVIGVAVIWFFGISFLAWIPLWSLILYGKILQKYFQQSRSFLNSAIAGWAVPLVYLLVFTIKWTVVKHEISTAYHAQIAPITSDGLPLWVKAGQRIEEDGMTKYILNSSFGHGRDFWFHQLGYQNDEGEMLHDPFVSVAAVVSPNMDFSEQTKQKLQNALSDSRHKTEPRLWSGDLLVTQDIVTNVQLFPAYRMAYTEKVFTIKNTAEFEVQQEAIYSFYLPEGSVVTSASLWIEGKEEPAYLTTKTKAEKAYNTIVGRERRDPLLVTWQEGNRVTARIFPCTPTMPRQFKIGITSPLTFLGEKLLYQSIDFDGPDKQAARETVRVMASGATADIDSDLRLKEAGQYLETTGRYQPAWKLALPSPPLRTDPFRFNGRSFHLAPLPEIVEPFLFKAVFLDLSDSWTKNEYKQILATAGDTPVFVMDDGKPLQITAKTQNQIFKLHNQLKYSVFPFHLVPDPSHALVVTKPSGRSPLPKDLHGSDFAKKLNAYFAQNNPPIKVANLGGTTDGFVAALRELRALQVHACSFEELLQLIENQEFPANQEDGSNIVIQQAGMKIRLSADSIEGGNAPDHLLRLFAYNDMMKRLGKQYFNETVLEDALLAQAQEANVVSPVSSLVTLETQADYDRFEIEKPKGNTLQNASIKDFGSVPEPHEWLLILLSLAFAIFLFYRKS